MFDDQQSVYAQREARVVPRLFVSVVLVLANAALLQAQPTPFDFSGTAYSQNFTALPSNTSGADVAPSATPTINGTVFTLPTAPTAYSLSTALSSSTITSVTGWYAVGPAKNVYGTNGGSTTTGGVYAFGPGGPSGLTPTDLGMISTSASGTNEVGLLLLNNTSSSYTSISLSYNADLWHQGTAAKQLNFGYLVESTATALPTTGLTAVSNLGSGSFAVGSAVQSTDGSAPAATNTVNPGTVSLGTTWAPNTYLWLTWTMNSTTGSGQGIGIGNLSFNASTVQTAIWNITSGTWTIGTGTNWTGATATVYTDGNNVLFNNNNGMGGTITLNTTVSPGLTTVSATTGTYNFTGTGSISGSGALDKSGGGTLDLTGMSNGNGYTGGTNVTGGTLIISNDNQLGASTGALLLDQGSTLSITGTITSARALTIGTGNAAIATNGNNLSTSNAANINGTLSITGSGNVALNGTATFGASGALTIGAGGSVTLGQASGSITMANGGTFTGNLVVANAIRVNFDNGVFSGGGQIQVQTTGTSLTNSGSAAGPGTVSAAISLNNTNIAFTKGSVTTSTYTSGTFVTNLGGTSSSASTSPITFSGVISGGSDLNIGNSNTGGGGGSVVLGLAGTPGGAGGYFTYAGTTNINNNGVITLASSNILPTSTDVIVGTQTGIGTATLNLNGFNQQIGSISDGANVTATAHTVTITNNPTSNPTSSPATLTIGNATTPANSFSGPITDGTSTLALVKTGIDTITLAGAKNAFSGGVTVNQGELIATGSGALGAGFVTVNPTGTTGTSADAATLSAKGGAISKTSVLTVNTNSATAIGTVLFTTASPGVGALNGTGSLILGSSTGTALTIGSATNNLSSNFSGVVSEATAGEGSIITAGTGTVTLSGTNTYSGGTTIGAGTLSAMNSSGSATGAGSVGVSSTATLAGGNGSGNGGIGGLAAPTASTQGFVTGPVTVADGATVAPGTPSTFGILTINGNMSFNSSSATGSTLFIKLSDKQNDVLVVTSGGMLNFGATGSNMITISLQNSGGTFNFGNTYVYTIAQADSASLITGFDTSNLNIVANGFIGSASNFQVQQVGNQLQLTFTPTAAPEPSQLLLFGVMAGGAGFGWLRRRRASKR